MQKVTINIENKASVETWRRDNKYIGLFCLLGFAYCAKIICPKIKKNEYKVHDIFALKKKISHGVTSSLI